MYEFNPSPVFWGLVIFLGLNFLGNTLSLLKNSLPEILTSRTEIRNVESRRDNAIKKEEEKRTKEQAQESIALYNAQDTVLEEERSKRSKRVENRSKNLDRAGLWLRWIAALAGFASALIVNLWI